jgi:Fic family protein
MPCHISTSLTSYEIHKNIIVFFKDVPRSVWLAKIRPPAISIAYDVEESRNDYYEALRKSSEDWHEAKQDLIPWLNYFLGVLRRAYREFERCTGEMKSPRGAKTVLVETAIDAFPGEFTLGNLERACPGVSRDMVRRVLRQLQKKDMWRA